MGHLRIVGITWGLLLTVATPLRAGFYDPRLPTSPLVTSAGVRPLPPDQFLIELSKLAAIGDTRPLKLDIVPNSADELQTLTALGNAAKMKGPRLAVLRERDRLLAGGVEKLNPTELAALAAVQWRLGDANAALATLKLARDRDPNNFWELTHRGSIYQGQRQYREAMSNLELAARIFPSPWPGSSPSAGDFFKEAEAYQLKLAQLRDRETQLAGGRITQPTAVDALFDVRFVGPGGEYEAGKAAGKLPPEAVAIVQQLLLWFPDDNRLLWLLGEVYNAEGNLEAALAVMDQFGWARGSEGAAMRDHRRIIRAAYDKMPKATEPSPEPPPSQPPGTPPTSPHAELLPGSWQVYTVAGVFGILLLALVYWQLSELLRRFRGTTIR